MTTIFLFFLFLLFRNCFSFYLPGIAVNDYKAGEPIEILANKLTSSTNTLPYDFYYIPFCKPQEKIRSKHVNLGQVLMGDRAVPTAYKVSMKEDVKCRHLCTLEFSKLPKRDFRRLKTRIKQHYVARLNVDNMPLVQRYASKSGQTGFSFGHPIGYMGADNILYAYNHLSFKILYHQPSLSTGEAIDALTSGLDDTYRIVGFEVEPFSVAHALLDDGNLDSSSCADARKKKPQPITEDSVLTYSYDVTFESSKLAWATRWDPILNANAEIKQIQWFSIVNSLMVSFFLTGLVATVLFRTVLKDFGRYNAIIDEEIDDEDSVGWKNVHADVFRPPRHAAFLCVCVGSGAQVLVMVATTLVFALIGFLSPANRGGLLSALLSLYVLASAVSGYVSSTVYNSIESNTPRRLVTLGTALLFPGITFSVFFFLNLTMWYVGSSGSVPFTTLLLLLFMWFGISVPLVFFGAYSGYRQKPITFPTRTNHIQRQIPAPPLGVSPYVYATISGMLPFGTVFMELVFMLNAVWNGGVYYLYGALVAVFGILVVTCAEMSIVSTYLTLSAEDWKSHWHMSFWGCASSAVYVFLYSIYYTIAQPRHDLIPIVSQLVFIGWSLVVSGAFGLMCGTTGFFSSLWFTRKIYSSIRID